MVKSKKLSNISILTGIACAMYVVESFIPLPMPLPGVRWGFSNLPVLLAAVLDYGVLSCAMIAFGKSFIGGLLSGRIASATFFMGLSGSIASALFMGWLKKHAPKVGTIGISELGALLNNTVQILIAGLILGNSKAVFYYYPYLVLIGTVTAYLLAVVSNIFLRSTNHDAKV
ncbi:MAG: Gx transporter family protein [Petrotogaceae bacterium]|nr:Gx transporter family protein [Petrotogaceae bacterium]